MKNITVTVDDDLYRRARVRAAREGTSVSRVVKATLLHFVTEESEDERRARELRALFDVIKLRCIEIPAVASGIDKHPAMVGLAARPRLYGIGHVEEYGRRVGGNLAKGKTIFVPRGFAAVRRHPINHGIPSCGTRKGDQHSVKIYR